MDRRTFLGTLAGGLLATPLSAEAQQAAKVPRVGILSSSNPRSDAIYQAFEQRLRDLGHVEGQNVGIEFRNADGRFERLTGLADELVVSTSTPLSLPARLRVARSRTRRTPFRS